MVTVADPPRTIKVCGIPYRVHVAPLGGDMGATSCETQTITIDPGQGPEQERRTVLHETLHAAVEACGVARWLGDAEEHLVSALDGVLLQVLRDNPRLVDYLTAR